MLIDVAVRQELPATASLKRNFTQFQRFIAQSESAMRHRRFQEAAAWAQIAGDFAWRNHPGCFADARIEAVLSGIAASIFGPGRSVPSAHAFRGDGDVRKVLHVLTETYAIGGHTRSAVRWIQFDGAREHALVLTRQQVDVPGFVTDALEHRGAALHRLGVSSADLIGKARALRKLAADADIVVLHTHPFDVVPLIAFGCGSPAPVVFFNHADHVFSIGPMAADMVANIRFSGRDLAIERRGVSAERAAILPMPLEAVSARYNQAEAKQAVGVDPEQVMLFTVASGSKYKAVDPPSFLDLVVPVVAAHPNVVLLGVGMQADAAWQAAAAATGGRIRALGPQPNAERFHQAADIYLDSSPFSSLTSSLEGALHGAAVVSFCPRAQDAAVFSADDVSLDANMVRSTTEQDYRQELGGLIGQARQRRELGERTRIAAVAAHQPAGWCLHLEPVYEQAMTVSPIPRPLTTPSELPGMPRAETSGADGFSGLDDLLCRWNEATGMAMATEMVVWRHRDALPPILRFKALAGRLRHEGRVRLGRRRKA